MTSRSEPTSPSSCAGADQSCDNSSQSCPLERRLLQVEWNPRETITGPIDQLLSLLRPEPI